MARKGHIIKASLVGRRRTEMKLTQAQMAERLGIHWVTQSNIENGKALVSLELAERIAEEIGVSRDELLGEPDDAEAASTVSAPADFGAALAEMFDRHVDARVEARLAELLKGRAA